MHRILLGTGSPGRVNEIMRSKISVGRLLRVACIVIQRSGST